VATNFHTLSKPFASAEARAAVVDAVSRLDALKVEDLTRTLARLSPPRR
jgi:hypothetical protein